MHTRCRGRCAAAAAILVAARATPVITVDDSDPGIEYRGVWTRNPWGRQNVNYWSSVTFTNASGSTATYRFQGTAIAVFGAFEMTGTFNVHSTYSVDGGPATDFVPADTFVSFEYGQKFFQSDTLSDEEHTLVITNLGEEFWFDYLEVTPPPPPTTTAPQHAQTPSASTAQATSSSTDRPITGSGGQPGTAQSLSSPSFQTQSTHSFSNTNNVTLTSTDAAATPPPHTSGASQSQTSILASGAATPGSTAARTDSSKLPAGAIAGLAIAGLVVLIFVGSVGHSRCGRRKQAQRQRRNDPTPYDPGLTALAFEHSEKRDRELHDGNRTDSAAASLLPLPLPAGVRAWGTSGERNLAHDIGTSDLEGTARMNDDRRTRFESSASPLSPRHSRGIRLQKASQITPNAGKSRYLSPPDDRRRSMDGGVRLAGGPMESERQEGDRGDDARSGVSTLPPAYGLYLAA